MKDALCIPVLKRQAVHGDILCVPVLERDRQEQARVLAQNRALPRTASTASRAAKPIMAARPLSVSACRQQGQQSGRWVGEKGGRVGCAWLCRRMGGGWEGGMQLS